MIQRMPAVVWAYVLLTILFVGANVFGLPYNGPRFPEFSFYRDIRQMFGGILPAGSWQLDHAALHSSLKRLPSVRFIREIGNSLRLATGQRIEWIIWGGQNPLMLFPTVDLWVSRGLNKSVEGDLTQVADIIAKYRQRLAREGWILIVVPVPVKLGIHRELCAWPVHESNLITRRPMLQDQSDEVYAFFRERLTERSIPNVDLQTVYREAIAHNPGLLLYATNDSHWSGAGIRLAAQATARTIAQNSALRQREPLRPTFYHTSHIGDLAKSFDPWPGLTSYLRPAWQFHDQLLNGEAEAGYVYPAHPVAVVAAIGTSYTGQYTWIPNQPVGFAWQLGLHLEDVEVQNRPIAGFGSFYAFNQFWKQRHEIAAEFVARHGPGHEQVVIWEFPLRDIHDIQRNPKLP